MISEATDETLDTCWNTLLPKIEEALSHGHGENTSLEEIYQALRNKTMRMWVAHEGDELIACMIFSLQIFNTRKNIFIEIIAGSELDSWLSEAESLIKKYKQVIGADSIQASCRVGLTKRLKNWRVKAVIMELAT